MTQDIKVKQIKPLNDFEEFKKELIKSVAKGEPLSGVNGPVTRLISQILNESLNTEMDYFLDNSDKAVTDNRRNGKTSKQVKSSYGNLDINTPRDRNSEFEPELIKKRQVSLSAELENKILSLYSSGLSYSDIKSYLDEMYAVEVSDDFINKITDKLLPQITEWQNRELETVYPIVFMDAMHFKCREDGRVGQKMVYSLIGINSEGYKDLLGFYFAKTEGASFWLNVLNDLKARGVKDILIACVDGLKGFPEAIQASFPEAEVQLCIVHQIRNSSRYIASRDQKEFMRDLKLVYKSLTLDEAESNLVKLSDKWQIKYPMVIKSWTDKWDTLSTYFKYSQEIRRLIYTTNPIEGYHRQIRKYSKSKSAFTSENALAKLIFVVYDKISKKWNKPLNNWALMISQLDIYFPNRLNVQL